MQPLHIIWLVTDWPLWFSYSWSVILQIFFLSAWMSVHLKAFQMNCWLFTFTSCHLETAGGCTAWVSITMLIHCNVSWWHWVNLYFKDKAEVLVTGSEIRIEAQRETSSSFKPLSMSGKHRSHLWFRCFNPRVKKKVLSQHRHEGMLLLPAWLLYCSAFWSP